MSSVGIDFKLINLTDIEVVLDRIVLTLWNGQAVLQGVMAHRYRIPSREIVWTVCFLGTLTEASWFLRIKAASPFRTGSATAGASP